MISVTYTPRWEIRVDELRVELKQVDNMICVDLPAGAHKVEMRYGMTWVGMLGWFITVLFLILTAFAVRFHRKAIEIIDKNSDKLLIYLQIKKET